MDYRQAFIRESIHQFEYIFDWCVHFLADSANLIGISYKEINVWVFCILWPLLTLWQTIALIRQARVLRRLRIRTTADIVTIHQMGDIVTNPVHEKKAV
jgi:hypothetical protein